MYIKTNILRPIWIIPLVLLFTISINAQEASTKIRKNGIAYITFNKNKASITTNSSIKDDDDPMFKKHTINIKKDYLNMYIKWLNPLQYSLKIKDTTINDIRIETIKKYFKENFSGIANRLQADSPTQSSFVAPVRSGKAVFDCAKIDKNHIVNTSFPDLYNALTTIQQKRKKSKNDQQLETEICYIMGFLATLLDKKTDMQSSQDAIKKQITDLYVASSPIEAKKLLKNHNTILKNFLAKEQHTIALLYNLNQLMKLESISKSKSLKKKVEAISKEQENLLNISKKLVELLKLYTLQIKSSLEKEAEDYEGYYELRTERLPKQKSVQLTLSLIERKLNTTDLTITDNAKTTREHTLLIQKYDFITPSVGTGIFYASTTLNAFGVTSNDQDELIVTEDDIEKDNAVIGVFLNLNIDIGSQFLSPILQIGVDPTKERPYLLIGGGFSIPVSNFSITGGPIWTWEPQLDTLKVDDTVSSTSLLEEDITYEFQTAPRGFYLGINYTF